MRQVFHYDVYPPTVYALTITYPSGDSRKRLYVKSINARAVAERHLKKGNKVELEILSCVPLRKDVHPAVSDWAISNNVTISTGRN
jgi:(2Fe-2S) ferredoxin